MSRQYILMKNYTLLQDAENFRWLEYQGNLFDFFHDLNINNSKIENFDYSIKCKSKRDKKERVLGSYPAFSAPAISQNANDVLVKHLGDLVQFLPLKTGKLGRYYILNIVNVLDCLDKEKSEIDYLSSSNMIFEIKIDIQ